MVRWVAMKNYSRLTRRGPDALTEELVSVLSEDTWFEFKPLFLVVYANLRTRNAAHGGEEMLRLRIYEKLQRLVHVGGVEKNGKSYRGIPSGLKSFTQHIAALHCTDLLKVVRLEVPGSLN